MGNRNRSRGLIFVAEEGREKDDKEKEKNFETLEVERTRGTC
jgi:hypothetical protein